MGRTEIRRVCVLAAQVVTPHGRAHARWHLHRVQRFVFVCVAGQVLRRELRERAVRVFLG
jgi:hypothetical protein